MNDVPSKKGAEQTGLPKVTIEIVEITPEQRKKGEQGKIKTVEGTNSWVQGMVDMLRIYFMDGRDFSVDLTRMLEVVSRHGVEVVSIRSAGEIEDAFLKRIEEDRMRGFSRAREGQERQGPPGVGR